MTSRGSSVTMAKIIKAIVGVLFIVAALSKFISLSNFEIYIYSLHLFSLNMSLIVARAVIAVEIMLGVMLVADRYHRATTLSTLLILLFFTALMAVVSLMGRHDDCQCMGNLIRFTPTQSLIKNAVLIPLVLYAWRWGGDKSLRLWLVATTLVLSALVLPVLALLGLYHIKRIDFQLLLVWVAILPLAGALITLKKKKTLALSVSTLLVAATLLIQTWPESWMRSGGDIACKRDMIERMIDQSELATKLEGRHVVALYSPSCSYCKSAAQKISLMQQRLSLPENQFINIMPERGSEIDYFYEDELITQFQTIRATVDSFLVATYGQFPIILLTDSNNHIVEVQDFRSLNEKTLANFLTH